PLVVFFLQTPGKGGSQGSDSDQQAADINNETSEGFICPQCMKSHNSAEELFKHYEVFHEAGDHASLVMLFLLPQEERWFSGELKKELDKVQGQLKQVIPFNYSDSACNIPLLYSELELKLHEAETEKFNIKQMKDLFEQKAAQLATEIVDIKSRYDEERSLREAAEQQVSRLTQEVQKERKHKEDLHTELMQRPGVEDVAVLKKELIQVQTLMDNMTREREEESERLKGQFERLKADHNAAEATISQLRAELQRGPQEAAVYTQQIHQLQQQSQVLKKLLSEKLGRKEKEYQELEEHLHSEQASRKAAQTSLQQRELELQQLQVQSSATQASLQRAQTELEERGEAGGRLRQELAELELQHQQLKAEFKQLQQQKEEREQQSLQQQSEIKQLHCKLLEAERQLGEVQGRLKEQRQLSADKLKDREQQVAELQLKLSRAEEQVKERESKATDLQHQLEKARQQHQEIQSLQQTTTGKLREAQNDLEQVLRQIGDKDQKIQNLEALLQKSKDSVGQLEAEREDLCAKIQAGEGEAAVLSQLQEKNHLLQEQVTKLTEQLKNQSESHKQAQENLHEQVQEQKTHLRTAQDRCLALESSNAELSNQLSESKERLAQLDAQLKAKTEMLLSAEAAKTAQRADLQNHLETAQHALQDKQQELVKTHSQMEELSRKLQEKQELYGQLEASLKECRDKLLTSEQETERLETQLKKLDAEAQKLKTSRDQAHSDLQQLRQQSTEAGNKIKDLSCQLATEKERYRVNTTRQELEQRKKEKSGLQQSLDQLSREAQTRQAELDQKLQNLARSQQKAQQEKEALDKELSAAKENLSKAQAELDTERKKATVSLEKQVGLQYWLSCFVMVVRPQLVFVGLGVGPHTHHLSIYYAHCSTCTYSHKSEFLSIGQVGQDAKLKQQLAALSQELSAGKTQYAELQKNCDRIKESQAQLQSDYYGKESELLAVQQDLKVGSGEREKLALAQEELVAGRNQLSRHETHIHELTSARAALEQEGARKQERLDQQQEALKELQRQEVSEPLTFYLMDTKSRLEKEVNHQTEVRSSCCSADQEVKELREAKQLLIQQKLEMQGRVENVQAALEQEKQEHQVTRESIRQRDETLKAEKAKMEAQLAVEQKAKAELIKGHEEAESKQAMQITALNENMSTLKREWQSSQRRVGELEKQTDELRGEIAVLEATVQNNQDERRALLERCVKGEGEIEKLQAKLVELRRKLDDTTAAMQELGRENQSLQIKQSQSLTRKWAEDHEVQNCMACGKGFSVTIRKHHCRHCGNIFCAECSSRNALTPSSKKAVRVCNTCYEELQG
uniref:Early endosome antigen 1 n=1 Tax=Scleropages formosus TaxID=113540 RepID=A0A8C9W3S1_SCLFO